jgi:hypothetical protein
MDLLFNGNSPQLHDNFGFVQKIFIAESHGLVRDPIGFGTIVPLY